MEPIGFEDHLVILTNLYRMKGLYYALKEGEEGGGRDGTKFAVRFLLRLTVNGPTQLVDIDMY